MITVIDHEGRLKYESPAVERILGWPGGHRLGMRAEDFVHPQHRATGDAAAQRVLADPTQSETLELRLRDSKGSWRWVESTITNLLDEPTVEGIVVNHRVVDERKALEDELIHRAFHDSLTGLANRGQLRGRVKASVGVTPSVPRRRSLLFIDLDDFKTVNDGFGHDAGDRLLVEVSDRLKRCVREEDLVARLGGDEFAVLIEEGSAHADMASAVAQRVIDALQEPFEVSGHRTASAPAWHRPLREHGGRRRLHADAGGHRDVPRQGQREEPVRPLHRRDAAGRPAPSRHGVVAAGGAGGEPAVRLLPADRHPGPAQGRGRRGARALAASHAGAAGTDEFLDVAEETGLIVPLGKQVLRDACAQIRLWRECYDENLMVSVNLSAAQLRDESIVDALALALQEAGVAPDALMIEVTEGALIGDVRGATAVLESLSALGVTIAIDDFGTGYSSLSHLQLFPVDVIKVDKTFVEDLCGGTEHSMLVRSVLAIAREFGLQVVAEGIESEEQEAQLRRLGCDYGQGYLYAHPVPASGIDELLGLIPALSVG